MSGFSAQTVARLSYDFTAFPKDGQEDERCTGKAFIPEPSKAKIKAFFEGFRALGSPLDEASTDEDIETAVTELEDSVYVLLAAVCSGKPSQDELRQLPPRILALFTRYLLENMAPKA